MEFIYIFIIVILVLIVIQLIQKQKKERQKSFQLIEATKNEMAASLVLQEKSFEKAKEEDFLPKNEVILEFQKMKDNYENQLNQYENKIDNLNSYIKSIEKHSRNFGEINTHKILTDLRNDLISEGIITSDQMLILSNVFIPFKSSKGEVHSRQIDHLILMNKGIFVIETKYWRGNIIYGINKKKAKEFSIVLDLLYPGIDDDTEKTIVFLNARNSESEEEKEVKIMSYDDPAKQVRTTAWTLNQLLKKEYNQNVFITPIVYFGYNGKQFLNLSSEKSPYVFDNRNDLCEFFKGQLIESKRDYSKEELGRIKQIIEKANYL